MNLMPLGFLTNLSLLYSCSFLHFWRSFVYVSLLFSQDLHEERVLKLQSISSRGGVMDKIHCPIYYDTDARKSFIVRSHS
jgi:hypothetical protein